MSVTVRLLVCGGRDFRGWATIKRVLATLPPGSVVIHGGARGADNFAGGAAKQRGLAVEVFPADWAAHGRAAGPRRNARMIAEGKPTHYYDFPGGAGKADMVRRCVAAGVPRWIP